MGQSNDPTIEASGDLVSPLPRDPPADQAADHDGGPDHGRDAVDRSADHGPIDRDLAAELAAARGAVAVWRSAAVDVVSSWAPGTSRGVAAGIGLARGGSGKDAALAALDSLPDLLVLWIVGRVWPGLAALEVTPREELVPLARGIFDDAGPTRRRAVRGRPPRGDLLAGPPGRSAAPARGTHAMSTTPVSSASVPRSAVRLLSVLGWSWCQRRALDAVALAGTHRERAAAYHVASRFFAQVAGTPTASGFCTAVDDAYRHALPDPPPEDPARCDPFGARTEGRPS